MNLQSAIRAARAESLERNVVERATRGRVLASIERSPRRRIHAVVAAVIASMFGASAFAWYARAPQARIEPPPAIIEVAPAVQASEPISERERTVAPVAIAPAALAEPPAVETQPAALALPPAPRHVAQPDGLLALYAEAHHLHFQAHDMAAALDAWDRYLVAAPNGTLAPEARFNRLVALVRLERWNEAATALAAFDSGDPTNRPDDVAKLRAVVSSHLRR